ncbi:hypothetical protein CLAIMM_14602 [Cladophialophora immunda]|nr:hypothetical protein CLAIMM_14602 [Cladophialophora immunda]
MDQSTLNEYLRQIYDTLDKNKELKQKLDFEVRRKRADNWEKVYNFTGLDFDTLNLLNHPDRQSWVQNPETFTSICYVPTWVTSHPAVQMGYQIMTLEDVGAQAAILRRVNLVVFEEICKRLNTPIEAVAQQLAQLMNSPRDSNGKDVLTRVDLWRKAGSRYTVWQNDLGKGIIIVMGTSLGHDFWERRVPKKGPQHDRAIEHLDNQGLRALAVKQQDLCDALVNHVRSFATGITAMNLVNHSNVWFMQGLTQDSYPQPTEHMLSVHPTQSLILPSAHETDEPPTAGHAQHGFDRSKVFNEAI